MIRDINEPKLQYEKDIIKINENTYIESGLYEKRGTLFCDVILNKGNEKIFIGRFPRESFEVKVAYFNNKILVYKDAFDKSSKKMKITDVLALYNILDDTFYSCKQIEALDLFNENVDSSKLYNQNDYIYRTDVEKIKRLKKTNC